MHQVILLADADPVFRHLLSLIFTTSGQYHYLEATNGPDALTLALEKQPDLAVIDAHLPPSDGVHFAKELRKQMGHNIRIMVMARRGSPLFEEDHEGGAPDRIIEKPFSPRSLASIIERLLVLSSDESDNAARLVGMVSY